MSREDMPHLVVAGDHVSIDGVEFYVSRATAGEPLHLQNRKTGHTRVDISAEGYAELWRTRRAWKLPDMVRFDEKGRERVQRLLQKHDEELDPTEREDRDRKLYYIRHVLLRGCSFSKSDLKRELPDIA